MADWTKPFTAMYSWWRVDRASYTYWRDAFDRGDTYATGTEVEQIPNITSATLQLNDSTDTFETGTASCVGPLDVGNDLIRCRMTATWEDGTTEDVVLGTYNVSIPSRDVLGSYEECSAVLDGRLIELQQDCFEQPYVVEKGWSTATYSVTMIARKRGLTFSELPETWGPMKSTRVYGLGVSDDASCLAAYNDITVNEVGLRSAKTDRYGRIRCLAPIDYGSTPVWAFEEGINATFLSEATDERDTTGVCNVVACVYEDGDATVVGTAEDTDPASPWSIANYGRRKVAVYNYSTLPSGSTAAERKDNADARAAALLDENRSVVRRVTIRHAYCPARVGDIVEVSYPSAGIYGRFAVRAQTIEVGSAGCMTTSELRRFERA